MAADNTLRLAAIGTLAGAFSGLFGVGGGTVIVPLLILWFGFGERLATGTSLAAIVLIGLLGALLSIASSGLRLLCFVVCFRVSSFCCPVNMLFFSFLTTRLVTVNVFSI